MLLDLPSVNKQTQQSMSCVVTSLMSAQEVNSESEVVGILQKLLLQNNPELIQAFCGCPKSQHTTTTGQPEPRKLLCNDSFGKQALVTPPALKYVLLPPLNGQEYYVCTTCGQTRKENSFFFDHPHGVKKPAIKWFCPLCQRLFSTSYRSGHLMKAHGEYVIRSGCRRGRLEKDDEKLERDDEGFGRLEKDDEIPLKRIRFQEGNDEPQEKKEQAVITDDGNVSRVQSFETASNHSNDECE